MNEWDPIEGLKLKKKSQREKFIESYRAKHDAESVNWNEEMFQMVLAAWDEATGMMLDNIANPVPIRAALVSEWDPKLIARAARWENVRHEHLNTMTLGCKPFFTQSESEWRWQMEVPPIIDKFKEDNLNASEEDLLMFLAELGYVEITQPTIPAQLSIEARGPVQNAPIHQQTVPVVQNQAVDDDVSPYAIAPRAPVAPPSPVKLLPPNGEYAGPPLSQVWEPEAAIYSVEGITESGMLIPGKPIAAIPAPAANHQATATPRVDVTRLAQIIGVETKAIGG